MISLNVILDIVNKALKDKNLWVEGYSLEKIRNWGLDKPRLSLKTQPEPGLEQCIGQAKQTNSNEVAIVGGMCQQAIFSRWI